MNEQIKMPVAAIKAATIEVDGRLITNNQCTATEGAFGISVPGQIDNLVLKNCVFMNHQRGHYIAP